jgi:hypothetical protein
MTKAAPRRLSVLMARQANLALIIRRGPARWVELILWDTKKDQFQRGQWFHGRIHEELCDLSPDQQSSSISRRNTPGSETRTYFIALALWPNGSAWGGGGIFLDNWRFWHDDWKPLHPRFSLKVLAEVSADASAGFGKRGIFSTCGMHAAELFSDPGEQQRGASSRGGMGGLGPKRPDHRRAGGKNPGRQGHPPQDPAFRRTGRFQWRPPGEHRDSGMGQAMVAPVNCRLRVCGSRSRRRIGMPRESNRAAD